MQCSLRSSADRICIDEATEMRRKAGRERRGAEPASKAIEKGVPSSEGVEGPGCRSQREVGGKCARRVLPSGIASAALLPHSRPRGARRRARQRSLSPDGCSARHALVSGGGPRAAGARAACGMQGSRPAPAPSPCRSGRFMPVRTAGRPCGGFRVRVGRREGMCWGRLEGGWKRPGRGSRMWKRRDLPPVRGESSLDIRTPAPVSFRPPAAPHWGLFCQVQSAAPLSPLSSGLLSARLPNS